MDDKLFYLVRQFTYNELIQVLETTDYKEFPVVENKNTMSLIGLVDREKLEVFL